MSSAMPRNFKTCKIINSAMFSIPGKGLELPEIPCRYIFRNNFCNSAFRLPYRNWLRNSAVIILSETAQNCFRERQNQDYSTVTLHNCFRKIPIFLVVLCLEMGIFDSECPFLGWNGGFWLWIPLFPILEILTPVRGKRILKNLLRGKTAH